MAPLQMIVCSDKTDNYTQILSFEMSADRDRDTLKSNGPLANDKPNTTLWV